MHLGRQQRGWQGPGRDVRRWRSADCNAARGGVPENGGAIECAIGERRHGRALDAGQAIIVVRRVRLAAAAVDAYVRAVRIVRPVAVGVAIKLDRNAGNVLA